MKNKKAGLIIPLLITIVALLAIGLGGYVYINQQAKAPIINQVENVVATTSDSVVNIKATDDQNITVSSTPNTKDDSYQDGEITGLIKSASKDSSGKITLGIDIIQTLSGKEAFLAMTEDFENGTNKSGDWSLAKDKFKTFAELTKYVRTISDSQFDDFYYSYQKVAFEKPLMGIWGAFPNGMLYTRNVNPQIRYYSIDKNLEKIEVISDWNSLFETSIDELYYACTASAEKWQEYREKHQTSFSCDGTFSLKVSQGVIIHIQKIFPATIGY